MSSGMDEPFIISDDLKRSGDVRWLRRNEVTLPVGAGKILQIVNTQTGAVATGTAGIPVDNTIPQNTEGTEFMSAAITPGNVNNKLLIQVVAVLNDNTSLWYILALFKDSVADALAAVKQYVDAVDTGATVVFNHYMTAGSISAITFKVRAGGATGSGGTMTFNGINAARIFGGVSASSITITEIAA